MRGYVTQPDGWPSTAISWMNRSSMKSWPTPTLTPWKTGLSPPFASGNLRPPAPFHALTYVLPYKSFEAPSDRGTPNSWDRGQVISLRSLGGGDFFSRNRPDERYYTRAKSALKRS